MAFVVLPLALYVLSYLPFMLQQHKDIEFVVKWQREIYRYHKNLNATHPYFSAWWTWPWLYRPTWYYFTSLKGWTNGIIAIGNPALWWASVPVSLVALWQGLRPRDVRLGLFGLATILLGIASFVGGGAGEAFGFLFAIAGLALVIASRPTIRDTVALFAGAGFFALYLPWAISPRTLNYSHYLFEAIPYACLSLGLLLDRHWDGRSRPVAIGVRRARRPPLPALLPDADGPRVPRTCSTGPSSAASGSGPGSPPGSDRGAGPGHSASGGRAGPTPPPAARAVHRRLPWPDGAGHGPGPPVRHAAPRGGPGRAALRLAADVPRLDPHPGSSSRRGSWPGCRGPRWPGRRCAAAPGGCCSCSAWATRCGCPTSPCGRSWSKALRPSAPPRSPATRCTRSRSASCWCSACSVWRAGAGYRSPRPPRWPVIAVAPFAWQPEVAAAVPLPVAAYVSPARAPSQFPLFPHAAFVLAGTVAGATLGRSSPERRRRHAVAWGGGLLLVGAALTWPLYGHVDFWGPSPAYALMRLGGLLVLLRVVEEVCQWAPRLVRPVSLLGHETLLVYVLHLYLLYGGVLGAAPLGAWVGRLGFAAAAGVLALMIPLLLLAAFAWRAFKAKAPHEATLVLAFLATVFVYELVTRPW
jgi:hypothetical protein